jgi:type IV secretory pathway TraG/TraD family ATPase VirD4
MYGFSRWCLRISCLAAWANVACLTLLTWPVSLVVIAMFILRRKWKSREWTTLGSARWATVRELERAGMIDADRGLILGRFAGKE